MALIKNTGRYTVKLGVTKFKLTPGKQWYQFVQTSAGPSKYDPDIGYGIKKFIQKIVDILMKSVSRREKSIMRVLLLMMDMLYVQMLTNFGCLMERICLKMKDLAKKTVQSVRVANKEEIKCV
ncbi:MAG: hypothetical protein ACOCRK_08015 [bacterium]